MCLGNWKTFFYTDNLQVRGLTPHKYTIHLFTFGFLFVITTHTGDTLIPLMEKCGDHHLGFVAKTLVNSRLGITSVDNAFY